MTSRHYIELRIYSSHYLVNPIGIKGLQGATNIQAYTKDIQLYYTANNNVLLCE